MANESHDTRQHYATLRVRGAKRCAVCSRQRITSGFFKDGSRHAAKTICHGSHDIPTFGLNISKDIFQDIYVFNLIYLLLEKCQSFLCLTFFHSQAWAAVSGSNFPIATSLLRQQKTWTSTQMDAQRNAQTITNACMQREHMRTRTSNEGGTVEPSNLRAFGLLFWYSNIPLSGILHAKQLCFRQKAASSLSNSRLFLPRNFRELLGRASQQHVVPTWHVSRAVLYRRLEVLHFWQNFIWASLFFDIRAAVQPWAHELPKWLQFKCLWNCKSATKYATLNLPKNPKFQSLEILEWSQWPEWFKQRRQSHSCSLSAHTSSAPLKTNRVSREMWAQILKVAQFSWKCVKFSSVKTCQAFICENTGFFLPCSHSIFLNIHTYVYIYNIYTNTHHVHYIYSPCACASFIRPAETSQGTNTHEVHDRTELIYIADITDATDATRALKVLGVEHASNMLNMHKATKHPCQARATCTKHQKCPQRTSSQHVDLVFIVLTWQTMDM